MNWIHYHNSHQDLLLSLVFSIFSLFLEWKRNQRLCKRAHLHNQGKVHLLIHQTLHSFHHKLLVLLQIHLGRKTYHTAFLQGYIGNIRVDLVLSLPHTWQSIAKGPLQYIAPNQNSLLPNILHLSHRINHRLHKNCRIRTFLDRFYIQRLLASNQSLQPKGFC